MNYSEQELQKLQGALYETLGEVDRICKKHGIRYFVTGGTAIGAYFWGKMLPWDDDVDVGMTRENYNKFLRDAPSVLKKGFFLQWVKTEPLYPFYFAKVRMDNTAFVEEYYRKVDMHHGIYVDIFPHDKVPDFKPIQICQQKLASMLEIAYRERTVWKSKYFGRCEIEEPLPRRIIPSLLRRIFISVVPRKTHFKMIVWLQTLFNNWNATYYNIVVMPRDHISIKSIEQPQKVQFGPLEVVAPNDLETYLRHHYPNLRRYIPEEEQENHHPYLLSFDTSYTIKKEK
jgi:lipopolysaccharide cholinephosphotransferase